MWFFLPWIIALAHAIVSWYTKQLIIKIFHVNRLLKSVESKNIDRIGLLLYHHK